MTQPAVSNHLRALEERFGVALLASGGRLTATLAGESLAEHARRVLGEMSSLEAEMARHAEPRGRLVVGASSTLAELLLPRLAVRFSGRYPDVALAVRVADTEETLAGLLAREFEVAIVGRAVEDPRLAGSVVEKDELVAVAAAGDPLAAGEVDPGDLAGRAFVLREEGSATRRAIEEGLGRIGVRPPRVAMELGSNAAVAGAVAAGTGLGVVPERTVEARPGLGRLSVRGLRLSRPFVLAVERGRPLSPATETFVEICGEKPGKKRN